MHVNQDVNKSIWSTFSRSMGFSGSFLISSCVIRDSRAIVSLLIFTVEADTSSTTSVSLRWQRRREQLALFPVLTSPPGVWGWVCMTGVVVHALPGSIAVLENKLLLGRAE